MIPVPVSSPLPQDLAREVAGHALDGFISALYFMLFILTVWGIFWRKPYVRTCVYAGLGSTLTRLMFALVNQVYGDFLPLVSLPEDALLTLIVVDIPLCAYFTWSRRARVTLECKVRPDDPLLVAAEKAGYQKDTTRAGAGTPSSGSAGARTSSGMGIGQAAHRQNAAQDQPKADTEAARRFELLLQYAPAVRAAYASSAISLTI
jgi:hypothetical protein